MKIQADGEEKISVILTKSDMTALDITYEELDYSNIETRRVIWTILDEARKVLGKPVDIDNRLLIRASPADDGGCFLQFTRLSEAVDPKRKKLIMKKEDEPLLLCSFDENAFLDCFTRLKGYESKLKNTEAYFYEGCYHIIVYPAPTYAENLLFTLCEYGDAVRAPRTYISELYEYGKQLS